LEDVCSLAAAAVAANITHPDKCDAFGHCIAASHVGLTTTVRPSLPGSARYNRRFALRCHWIGQSGLF